MAADFVQAVKDCASRAQGTQPEELSNLKIKWPNDLYYRTKKVKSSNYHTISI